MNKLFYMIACMALAIGSLAGNDERRLGLLEFSVVQNGSKTDIKWSLSREPMGNYFTIEKSADGKNFSKLIDLPVTESGNLYEEYFETDYQPYPGVSFYRIRQTDEMGHAYYSEVLSMKFNAEQGQRQFSRLPDGEATLAHVRNAEGKEALFVLRDADGNDFYSVINLQEEDKHLYAGTAEPPLPPGIYRIVGASNNQLYSLKLIVK